MVDSIILSFKFFRFHRPQVSGITPSSGQQLSTTAKYFVRSELKQFARYLTGFLHCFSSTICN